jgi:hypothetical protein
MQQRASCPFVYVHKKCELHVLDILYSYVLFYIYFIQCMFHYEIMFHIKLQNRFASFLMILQFSYYDDIPMWCLNVNWSDFYRLCSLVLVLSYDSGYRNTLWLLAMLHVAGVWTLLWVCDWVYFYSQSSRREVNLKSTC